MGKSIKDMAREICDSELLYKIYSGVDLPVANIYLEIRFLLPTSWLNTCETCHKSMVIIICSDEDGSIQLKQEKKKKK